MPAQRKNTSRRLSAAKLKELHKLLVPTIVSRIIDPPIVIALLTIIGIIKSEFTNLNITELFVMVPVVFGLPIIYFLWTLKSHLVSNWDITNRKERIVPLTFLTFFLALDMALMSFFQNQFLLQMFMLYFLWTLGFLVITLFWKISGHTGIATLALGLLTIWFGPWVLPFFILIPLVAWARIVRHDHTLAQVTTGVLYSSTILAFWYTLVY